MIQLAVSLGGVKSLIEVASGMTHPDKYMSSAERLEGGLGEALIRFRCVIIPCYMQGQNESSLIDIVCAFLHRETKGLVRCGEVT